ncbi:glycosyltransferase [Deltaproteobacteria bacterium TL4]
MMVVSQIRTLVLYALYTQTLSYYNDWIDAFVQSKQFNTDILNLCNPEDVSKLRKTIKEYEFIVLLHSTNADTLSYLEPLKNVLKDRKAKLLTFVGNEVNLPGVSMKHKIQFIQDINADYIGTQLPLEAGKWLFEACSHSKVIALPHALNPEAFQPVIPQPQRLIDLGVRTYKYSVFLGDNERNQLLNYFSQDQVLPHLKKDFSTNHDQRFNREGWADFLNRCKGTLATEAGSWFLERDDDTVQAIQAYILEKSKKDTSSMVVDDSSFILKMWDYLPQGLKNLIKSTLLSKTSKSIVRERDVYETTTIDANAISFEEIYNQFYQDKDTAPVYSKCISSRHFDAIGTKTCQIMFEGKYNGILIPNEHYIALRLDFSNVDEVLEKFMDESYRQKIVDQAYEAIMDQHTYSCRVQSIYQELTQTNTEVS